MGPCGCTTKLACQSYHEKKASYLFDKQKVSAIAEIISKYNLLAVPVVDDDFKLRGTVVVDDIVEDLIRERRTRKR